MHYSLYNHITEIDNGHFGLYNLRTGQCVRLNYLTKHFFDNILEKDPKDSKFKLFREKGFIVDFDEKRRMKIDTIAASVKQDCLGLLICPTMNCNFDCLYCFEKHHQGKMSEEVQGNILEFIKYHEKKYKIKHLNVQWYGGEPLLEPEIIRDLSQKMIEYCGKEDITYKGKIVTNGYFLTQENIDMLENAKVTKMQITLDGPTAESHDRTRHLVSGQGTFDTIINNLRSIKTNIKIRVRCNVHKENKDLYPELEKLIEEIADKTGNTVTTYPGIMESEVSVHDRDHSEELELSLDERVKLKEQSLKGKKRGYRFHGDRCIACNLLGIAIDEQGNLYKCWDKVGDIEYTFGNISNYAGFPDEPLLNYNILDQYYEETWPEKDATCMNCKALPVCRGGCPIRAIYYPHRKCVPLKDEKILDNYVKKLCENLFMS